MSLDEHVLEAFQTCADTPPRVLIANLSTLCSKFDEIFAVKCLKAAVAKRVQHCIIQSGGKAANLRKQCSPGGLQMRLLEECLGKDDWKKLKSSFRETFFTSHKSSAASLNDESPVDAMAAEEVNVLSFADDITMETADEEANFHLPNYLDALKILEDALEDCTRKNGTPDSNGTSHASRDPLSLTSLEPVCRRGDTKKYDSMTLLTNVGTLLDQCPEVLLQLNEWPRFICVLIGAAHDKPKEGSKVVLHYFRLAGARQRGTLLSQMLRVISRGVQQPRERQKISLRFNFLLACILSCTEELPENWLGLLDDEVGALFSLFLNNAALPYLEYFSQMDPSARWVQNWSQRPTFECLVKHQLLNSSDCHPVLAQLQGSFPNQYALSLAAYFLPILMPSLRSIDDGMPRIAEHGNHWEQLDALLSEFISSIIESSVVPDSAQLLYKFAVSSCASSICSIKLWGYVQSIVSIIQSLLSDKGKVYQQGHVEAKICWLFSLAECFLCSTGSGKTCTEIAHRQLLNLANDMKKVRSHAVSAAARSFWQSVLCKHWGYVVDHVLSALSMNRGVLDFPVFTLGHLVSLSRDLDGWLHIQEYFMQHADALDCVDGNVILNHILGLFSTEVAAELPLQFDASIFALLSRLSTHSTILQKLLKASRMRCERYFGAPRNEDLLGLFFLPPGDLEISSDFQCTRSPLEQNVGTDFEHLQAFFHLRVFLFLNLVSLDGKGTTHAECSDTIDATLPFLVDTCLNAFLASFTASNSVVYTDDTRLFLLCLVSLALLFSSRCEEALWYGGPSVSQRMCQLSDVCQQRAGVDPIFLVGRFLTSGRGRKRLLPILLHGFKADLPADTIQTFHHLSVRGPTPSQSQRFQITADAENACLVIGKAFSHEAIDALGKVALVEFISLWVQVCSAVDKVPTPEHVALLLRKRSLTEWLQFLDKKERAACVARAVKAHDGCKTSQLLQSSGMDVLYMSTLCVTRWMGSASNINKAKNRNRFKNSVKLFVDKGLRYWDEFVASCLTAHITSVTQGGSDLVERGWEVPYSSLVPLPSALFAELLIRPFSLHH